jgi:hypothetical protein
VRDFTVIEIVEMVDTDLSELPSKTSVRSMRDSGIVP